MPDNPKVTVSYDHLLYLAQKGTNNYEPDGARKEYRVNELLGQIIYYNEPIEKIFQKIEKINNKIDKNNPKSISEAKNKILMFKLNFMGIGINFNEIVAQIGKQGFNKFLEMIRFQEMKPSGDRDRM